MRDYLQGLIDSEQATLNSIAQNAIDAGATQQQLSQIIDEASTAALNDPIDVEEWDGGESAIFAAWVGWRLGQLQGTLNSINGVTDIGIGTVNQGITIVNPLGQLFGLNPQIPLWDWSRGFVTDEDPTLHEWSKWLGGSGAVIFGSVFLGMVNAPNGPLHHLATNKNWISDLRGGPWSPRFDPIFKKAGMTLDDLANKVNIPGHKGPHPEAYHKEIFRRLQSATDGLNGDAYKSVLLRELEVLGTEASTVGTILNRLLTGG